MTLEDVLQLEATKALNYMAAFDWREWMFHQANLIKSVEPTGKYHQ